MSRWPLLMCPACGAPIQHFAISVEQNMFMCIGERKREKYRGVVQKETMNELKECSYPFTEQEIDVAFFVCAQSQTFKKALQISEFLTHRKEYKHETSLTITDPLPTLILEKSYSYLCETLTKPCYNVSETEVSTEDFCVNS